MRRRIESGKLENAGSHSQGWCRMCGRPLEGREIKVVVSSQAVGGVNLPTSERLICGQCFLTREEGAQTGAVRKKVAMAMAAK